MEASWKTIWSGVPIIDILLDDLLLDLANSLTDGATDCLGLLNLSRGSLLFFAFVSLHGLVLLPRLVFFVVPVLLAVVVLLADWISDLFEPPLDNPGLVFSLLFGHLGLGTALVGTEDDGLRRHVQLVHEPTIAAALYQILRIETLCFNA